MQVITTSVESAHLRRRRKSRQRRGIQLFNRYLAPGPPKRLAVDFVETTTDTSDASSWFKVRCVRSPSFTFTIEHFHFGSPPRLCFWGDPAHHYATRRYKSSRHLMRQVRRWIRAQYLSAGKQLTELQYSAGSRMPGSLRFRMPRTPVMPSVSQNGLARDTQERCDIYRVLMTADSWCGLASARHSNGRDRRSCALQTITATSHFQLKHKTHGVGGLRATRGQAAWIRTGRADRATITRCCSSG